MNREELIASLAEIDEEIALADGFEDAYLGIIRRCGQSPHAIYDRAKCIEILVARDGMDESEAEEFFEYNVAGAWVGPGTPGFVWHPA